LLVAAFDADANVFFFQFEVLFKRDHGVSPLPQKRPEGNVVSDA
jgi:hypothetical protein